MTRVFKEHEIKTKMEQEQWLHLRMLFLLGYNLKIIIWWGGGGGTRRGREGGKVWLFVGEGGIGGGVNWGDFYRRGVMIKFLAGGRGTPLTSPYPPLAGKTLYINGSVSQQQWSKIKWNALSCKVKQGGVDYGKEGLSFYILYGQKIDKILKSKSLSVKGRGKGRGIY